MDYVCPVCGYNELEEPPYDADGHPSYEICDCCGYEFGFEDGSEGISFEEYRKQWIAEGANWMNRNKNPEVWDYKQQLRKILKE